MYKRQDVYSELYRIYNIKKLTKENIARFGSLLNTSAIKDSAVKVRLLGDELCDRGRNDYFTLMLIDRLDTLKCDFEILLSNHSAVFIYGFEKQHRHKHKSIVDFHRKHLKHQSRSMKGLQYLLRKKLVSLTEIDRIFNDVYKNKIKVVSYYFEQKTDILTIYSHAPIDIEAIYQLAYTFSVSDEKMAPHIINKQEVMKLIDGINERMCLYLTENRLTRDHYSDISVAIENRKYDHLAPGKPELLYIHGHDQEDRGRSEETFRKTLDNDLGKSDDKVRGSYEVQRYVQEPVDPQLVPIASVEPVVPQPVPVSSGPVVREKSSNEPTQKSVRFFPDRHSDVPGISGVGAKKYGTRTVSQGLLDDGPDHGDNRSDSHGGKKLKKDY